MSNPNDAVNAVSSWIWPAVKITGMVAVGAVAAFFIGKLAFGAMRFGNSYEEQAKAVVEAHYRVANIQVYAQQRYEDMATRIPLLKAADETQQQLKETVAKANAAIGGAVNIDASKFVNDPEAQRKLAEAQNTLTGAMGRFLAYKPVDTNMQTIALYQEVLRAAGENNRMVTTARADANRAVAACQSVTTSLSQEAMAAVRKASGKQGCPAFYQAPASATALPDTGAMLKGAKGQ